MNDDKRTYTSHWSEEYMPKKERKKLHDLLWKYSKWKYEKYEDYAKRRITVDELLNEIAVTLYYNRRIENE